MVVLDVMMPDVDGREVLRRMRELNPDVRVILSSGFTVESDPIPLRGRDLGPAEALHARPGAGCHRRGDGRGEIGGAPGP